MTPTAIADPIVYPECDGKPMAESTQQYQWIVTFNGNIEATFADRADVFVGSDNFVYPVQGRPDIVCAPDVYVAFGRPRGHRRSYRVWAEGGVFPQVVIEVLSPGNRDGEMANKLAFFDTHGAEEYYVFDPYNTALTVYLRGPDGLVEQPDAESHVSPRLGCRFDLTGLEMVVYYPDGRPYLTFQEQVDERIRETRRANDSERRYANAERQRSEAERQRSEAERQRSEAERQRSEAERRAEKLAAKLRALGLDPELNGH